MRPRRIRNLFFISLLSIFIEMVESRIHRDAGIVVVFLVIAGCILSGCLSPEESSPGESPRLQLLTGEVVTDLPSIGSASAYMDVLIQENYDEYEDEGPTLSERIEFSEETAVDGGITLFKKMMHYESVRTSSSVPVDS
jgi:hypothetical protein